MVIVMMTAVVVVLSAGRDNGTGKHNQTKYSEQKIA
ncbi:hypothetical protein AciX9_1573 [Granulicella tundricola MP5ACTX9]|uniref:Uncharacterized protein n=1 Tax=Granulicella tundricola (strain ATCC BAA-1859 / DSM 23138 / MP5ACTX9) TaxID=1198114 RepID=E8WXL0_GRATM|nr:hypothetical protein AciX9_1573 [Granulicella tundricola MP5ACTX9]